MREAEAEGMVRVHASGLDVTELGRVFIRNLCFPFDAYLPDQQKRRGPMFSRTV